MPTTEANGQTLYYEVHGEGEPLLCVMGLAADMLAWALQRPGASRAAPDDRVRQPRRRPVARSRTAPYEIADMAQRRAGAGRRARARALPSARRLDGGRHRAGDGRCAAPERVRTLTLGGDLRRRRGLGAQPQRGLGRAAAGDQLRAAHGRADAAQPLRGVLRERRTPSASSRSMMLAEPAPAAARGVRPPARRLEPPRRPRPARARCRCRCT